MIGRLAIRKNSYPTSTFFSKYFKLCGFLEESDKFLFYPFSGAFTNRLAVAILRLPNGTDFSHLNVEIPNTPIHGGLTASNSSVNLGVMDVQMTGDLLTIKNRIMHADSNLNLAALGTSTQNSLTIPMPREYFPFYGQKENGLYLVFSSAPMPNQRALREAMARNDIVYSTRGGSCVPKHILDALGIFHTKQENRTIDVWWLYDDGGLTMLLPYIISTRNSWASSKIRVFALVNIFFIKSNNDFVIITGSGWKNLENQQSEQLTLKLFSFLRSEDMKYSCLHLGSNWRPLVKDECFIN